LDRFLASSLSASRSELQRWIENGAVTLDGSVVKKASERLREGAKIQVTPEPPATTDAEPDAAVKFEVVHIDDAVIVINKPAGLVVHPARGHASGTLVNGLLALGVFDAADEGVKGSLRPGIVHRLDKGTTGLMVVARSSEAREHLKAQFSVHSIEREYVAIAVGDVQAKTFDTLHGRHPTDRLRFSSRVTTGKRAVTHVRPLKHFAHATLISCRLETGRTHQIRVHLADGGTPLLGDELYGKPPKDLDLRAIGKALNRPALHARVLGFVHPLTQKQVHFEAEPPADFERALAQL
jgi:23S rRNA pseudouridine1911/1915/1917 synthase